MSGPLDFFNPSKSTKKAVEALLSSNSELIEVDKEIKKLLNDTLKPIVDSLGSLATLTLTVDDILKGVTELIKCLSSVAFIVSQLAPLVDMFAKAYDDVKDVSVDRLLKAPNLDKDNANRLSAVLAVPYVGTILQNQINLAWMDRYQHITGRGFPTVLDQLRFLVSGGVTPANMVSEITTRAPDFFLENETDVSKFNKGYKDALKEKTTHKAVPRPKLP